jgi:hypothetical protein
MTIINNTFETLNSVFEIHSTDDDNSLIALDNLIDEQEEHDISDDLIKTRDNLFSLLEKGEDALDNILSVAKQSESPRCYEVFSSLLKNLADINHQILDIHKKKQELDKTKIKPENSSNNPQIINNSLFVGSTNELQQLLANTRKEVN